MAIELLKERNWNEIGFQSSLPIIGNRVVTFIDILGFKNLIKNNSLKNLARAYETILAQVLSVNKRQEIETRPTLFPEHPLDLPYCKTFMFSDSIIIIANGPSQIETLKTLIFTWRTFQQLLVSGLTARGAVSFGEIYINTSKNIFLGSALTKAYELEQTQEWVGAIVDDNVFEAFPMLKKEVDNKDGFLNKLFLRYEVPLKNKKAIMAYTINWRANLMLEKGAKSLFEYTGEKIVDIKFDNTIEYCKVARHYSHKDDTPVELSVYWSGSTQPPFKDADE